MDVISARDLKSFSKAIEAIAEAYKGYAGPLLDEALSRLGTDVPKDAVEEVLKELEPLFQSLAEDAANVSATLYDLMREAWVGEALGAEAFPDRDTEWTRKALYSEAEKHKHNMDAFKAAVLERMDYEARRAAGSTQFKNGVKDPLHPRFARVPTGSETCHFCIMLASRGAVYCSEDTTGELDHYHAHCDCRVVPVYEWETVGKGSAQRQIPARQIGNYDPEYYYRVHKRIENAKVLSDHFYEGNARGIVKHDEEIRKERNLAWRRYKTESNGRRDPRIYQETYGEYIRSLSVVGSLSVEDFAKPWPREIHLAQWFSDFGKDVLLLCSDGEEGEKHADYLIDGVIWEAKQLTSPMLKKIRTRVNKGRIQSRHIIVDLSRSTISKEAAMVTLAELLEDETIEEFLLVTERKIISMK